MVQLAARGESRVLRLRFARFFVFLFFFRWWFLYYFSGSRDWNIEGTRSTGAQSFAILFGAAKRALSLSLVLMVCMGYGVVRPSLGRDVHKIMGLALVYFISSAVSQRAQHGRGGC